jgi:hypothetical protein
MEMDIRSGIQRKQKGELHMRRVTVGLASMLITLALLAPPSAAVIRENTSPSLDELGNKTIDTNASDGGTTYDTGRVDGMKGTIGYSQRQTDDAQRYPMPVVSTPCQAAMNNGGTATPRPLVQTASAKTGNVHIRQTANTTPTNTLEFDPADPPQVYFAVCRVNENNNADAPAQDEVFDWLKTYFSRTKLPTPTPEISAKDGGICGVVHTVDLHMPTELLHRDTTPFGSLDLHIYGRVIMDWGDETRHDVYTTGGGPYPYSAISHYWTDRGFYNIKAHADWIANYRLGPYNGVSYTGVLSGISTEGAINDFRVWEAQAMLIK